MTIEQTNVIVMPGAARRQQMHVVPNDEPASGVTCAFCHGTGRWMQGMVSDPDEHTGLRSVQWPNPPVIGCTHPPQGPEDAA